ncbi:unnamed protein product [Phytophthora fragariaefolia]|uniref:Unnamed protein product n=1 Tax=Phytophthora fragariaefolia TaxID=1490495 RepID=A0A9W6XXT5_9STRA|nr:unnamed protein product [Phytophthora fragariaefolia]
MQSFPFSETARKPEALLAMTTPPQGAEPREEGVEPRGGGAEAKEEGAEPREEGEAAIRASSVAAVGPGRATSVLEALTPISAPAPRKRGRPKGSKNKPKPGQLAAKQSRSTQQVPATQNRSTTPRRSLDEVLTEEAASADVPQFVQGANTELPIYAAESTVLPPTPTAVARSGNPTVLPNEGLPDQAHSIATEPTTPSSSKRAKRIPLPSVLSILPNILMDLRRRDYDRSSNISFSIQPPQVFCVHPGLVLAAGCWRTNTYARLHDIAVGKPFSLDEAMTFLGILLFLALVDKGEYSNYWGTQVESAILSGTSSGLDDVMALRRFKELRKAFCFQCVEANPGARDQAARIRPLLNLLKTTRPKYVEIGRNVALDEASVSCRSKYGKSLVVYNPLKPTGRYHFRIYMLCCASSWLSLNFRLHCGSDISDRLGGVVSPGETQTLSDEVAVLSSIRKCVLEVVRPLYKTRRIVNSDNYYTSVQLLMALRLKGLYTRGTVRKTSAHFPRHVLLEKKDCSRGVSRQGVSTDHSMVAASWHDSAIVTVISNADPSTLTTVTRQVRAEQRSVSAPTCIKEYNANMQGVDRLDQIRARFSLADGHSFKKWHKKLALALVDVARANTRLFQNITVASAYGGVTEILMSMMSWQTSWLLSRSRFEFTDLAIIFIPRSFKSWRTSTPRALATFVASTTCTTTFPTPDQMSKKPSISQSLPSSRRSDEIPLSISSPALRCGILLAPWTTTYRGTSAKIAVTARSPLDGDIGGILSSAGTPGELKELLSPRSDVTRSSSWADADGD